MLADFDDACGKIGLQLNLTKTMFMRNGWVPDAPFSLNGATISKCSSYAYLGREVNMVNDPAPELDRRKRAAWGVYKSVVERSIGTLRDFNYIPIHNRLYAKKHCCYSCGGVPSRRNICSRFDGGQSDTVCNHAPCTNLRAFP